MQQSKDCKHGLAPEMCHQCRRNRPAEPMPDAELASKVDLLIHAARSLPGPFSSAQLTVRAWELFPGRFGMKSFLYPDSHMVAAVLYRELLGRGLLIRVARGRFQVAVKALAGKRVNGQLARC